MPTLLDDDAATLTTEPSNEYKGAYNHTDAKADEDDVEGGNDDDEEDNDDDRQEERDEEKASDLVLPVE